MRFVYAAYDPEHRQIKIGCSVSPTVRCREFGTRRFPVHLLAQIPGTFYEERRIHRRLKAYRARQHSPEWFVECPEVMLEVSQMMFLQQARRRLRHAREAR